MGGLWIGIGAVLVVAGLAWVLRPRRRRAVVLGEQMAAANRAEARWQPAGPPVMPDQRYDMERGDHDLLVLPPSPLDDALRALTRSYAQLDGAERETVRGSIDQKGLYQLIHFAKRSAVLAVRTGDPARCIDGLDALAMIDLERIDHRDHAWALGILDWAVAEVGLDARESYDRAGGLASPVVAARFRSQGERPAGDRTLAALGYRAVETELGIGLAGCGSASYAPGFDLLSVVRRITELLNDDRFFAHEITLATEIPDAWFQSEGRDRVKAMLARARAVAQTSARPDRGSARPFDHLFTCWIAEMPDTETSSHLKSHAVGPLEGGGAAVGFAVGEVFGLLVSRPTVQGVAPLHTMDEIDAIATRIRGFLAESLGRGVDAVR